MSEPYNLYPAGAGPCMRSRRWSAWPAPWQAWSHLPSSSCTSSSRPAGGPHLAAASGWWRPVAVLFAQL